MSTVGSAGAVTELIAARLAQRRDVYEALVRRAGTSRWRACCHAMAERFARGGRLLAIGVSPTARSDVRHVAVEFVHPVIVGKRALPALGLVGDSAPLATEVRLAAGADDIVMAFGDDPELSVAIAAARAAGAITVAFAPLRADWELVPPVGDPFIAQELVETAYHVLWELVHVFFEHRGLLQGRTERRVPRRRRRELPVSVPGRAGARSRGGARRRRRVRGPEGARGLRAARGDAAESGGDGALAAAAAALRGALDAGGRLMALGNGGSATDAMDVVADFAMPPAGGAWPARPALDLTADAAILTAIANDIGVEAIFARQIIAHGRAGDVLLVLSTSGSSASAVDALAQARRQGLVSRSRWSATTAARSAPGALADHVIVAPSQHIPRIQEAQATVYHLLRELVEL